MNFDLTYVERFYFIYLTRLSNSVYNVHKNKLTFNSSENIYPKKVLKYSFDSFGILSIQIAFDIETIINLVDDEILINNVIKSNLNIYSTSQHTAAM